MELKLAEAVQVETNSSIDGEDTTIDQEDLDILVLGARENIYSNPIQTCPQEYINNARDACRDAGHPDHLMDITWPTPLDMVFRVRDYGIGLSDHDMKTVFNKLAKSTKRKNSKLAGKYGLGSKIALAYTDAFTITSWYNGFKRQYLYHKASNQKGRLTDLGEPEFTTEQNGLMIEVAIKNADHLDAFRKAIIRACGWWPQVPNIIGLPEDIKQKIESRYLYEDEHVVVLRHEDSGGGLMVDHLPYNQDYNFRFAVGSDKFKKPVYFKVGLGDVHIPMSREGVSVDDQYKALLPILKERLEAAKQNILKKFDRTFSNLHEVKSTVKEVNGILDAKTTIMDVERRIAFAIDALNIRITFEEPKFKTSWVHTKRDRQTPSVSTDCISAWQDSYCFETNLPTDHRLRQIRKYARLDSYNIFSPEVMARPDLVSFFDIKPLTYVVPKVKREKSFDANYIKDTEYFQVWYVNASDKKDDPSGRMTTNGNNSIRVKDWAEEKKFFYYVEMTGTQIKSSENKFVNQAALALGQEFTVLGLPTRALKAFKDNKYKLRHVSEMAPVSEVTEEMRALIIREAISLKKGYKGWYDEGKYIIDKETTDPDLKVILKYCTMNNGRYEFTHSTPEFKAEIKLAKEELGQVIDRVYEKHKVLWHIDFNYRHDTRKALKGWFK